MNIKVDYIIEDNKKPLMIRLRGDDLSYLASNGSLSITLSEDEADNWMRDMKTGF